MFDKYVKLMANDDMADRILFGSIHNANQVADQTLTIKKIQLSLCTLPHSFLFNFSLVFSRRSCNDFHLNKYAMHKYPMHFYYTRTP